MFQLLNINNFSSHCIQVHHFQIYQLQLSVPIVSSVFTFHHHAQFILLISLISTSDLNFIILNSSILIWFSTSDSNFFSFNFCLKFKYQYHTQNLHFLNFNFDFCFLLLPQPLTVLYSSIFVLTQSSSFLNSNSISSSVFIGGFFVQEISSSSFHHFQFQILISYSILSNFKF